MTPILCTGIRRFICGERHRTAYDAWQRGAIVPPRESIARALRGDRIRCMLHVEQAPGMCLLGCASCCASEKGKSVVRRWRKAYGPLTHGR